MKKIFSLLIAFTVLSFLPVSTDAATFGFNTVITADVEEAEKGDAFSVLFYANDIAVDGGIVSLDLDVNFDSDLISVSSYEVFCPEEWEEFQFGKQTEEGYHLSVLDDTDQLPNYRYTVTENNALGFKLTFTVVTGNKVDATVSVSDDGISALCTSAKNLASFSGHGSSITLSLNKNGVETPSEDVSVEPDSSAESETISAPQEEQISSNVGGEKVDDSEASQKNEPKEGFNIITFLVIACVVVAAGAVIYFAIKNKKIRDDQNPVNPG